MASGERQKRKRLKKEGTLQEQYKHEFMILVKDKARPLKYRLSFDELKKTPNFPSALKNFKRLGKLIRAERGAAM